MGSRLRGNDRTSLISRQRLISIDKKITPQTADFTGNFIFTISF